MLGAFITPRDRNLSPVSPNFPFPPLSLSFSSLLRSPCGAPAALPGADQSSPNAAHPSARHHRTQHPELHGQFGAQTSPFGSYFLHLFPFCSVFVEDKGRHRLKVERAAGAELNPEKQSACFHGNALERRQEIWKKGEHRAGERSGGELSSVLVSWCGQSREKKENGAGSFPAGIGHCLKPWNTDKIFN